MRYISLFSGINSFAVPVVRWIGERIAMADKEGE